MRTLGWAVYSIFLICVCLAMLKAVILPSPQWTVDSFSYARMTVEMAGVAPREALRVVEDFYLTLPLARDPRYRPYVTVDAEHAPPAAGPVFRARLLYPWLSSLVYRSRGLRALSEVSAGAYVAACLAVFWLLGTVARPQIALAGATVFALTGIVLRLARMPTTDMTALALWIGTLASVLTFLNRPRIPWAVIFGAATIALALTRQVIYLPVGAVGGSLMAAVIRRDAGAVRRFAALGAAAAVGVAASIVWTAVRHAAGVRYELELGYRLASRPWLPAYHTMGAWYRSALSTSIRFEAKRAVLAGLPVAACISLVLAPRRLQVGALLGAATFGLITLLLDPVPDDLPRTFEAPLYPVLLAAVALGAEGLAMLVAGRTRADALGAGAHRSTTSG